MKTLQEILNNYNEWGMFLEDRFGIRLCSFLTVGQAKAIGFGFKPEYAATHKPLQWTRENILAQLKKDVEFGFEKALDKRGISSELMFNVVSRWNKVLEEGLENFAGCAVIISHDRWFLDRVATHILAFEGNSQVYFFEGSYSEYEENKMKRLGNVEPKRFRYKKLKAD